MRGNTGSIGPEGDCREMVMLSLLAAFARSGHVEKKLDVGNLHRALTSVKKNLERDEFPVLKRLRFELDPDGGRYHLFDDLMKCLERDGVLRVFWHEDREVAVLGKDSAEALTEKASVTCFASDTEKKALTGLCDRAMTFYWNLRRTFGRDG